MIETIKTLNKEYFDSIEIDVTVDDLEIVENNSADLVVKILATNSADNQVTDHFIKCNKYDVFFEIKNRVLLIYYFKNTMILLDDIDYVEMIGCHIEIPKGIPYKIIENEED